jgi:uncharacterized membrane protein SpoIIM required for sporulation
VDLDAFIAQHSAEWNRLDALVRRRRLDAAEADELVSLYRRTATHLSLVQSRAPDPVLAARLSSLLARGRAATIGTPKASGWAAFARGVTVSFPVALYTTWKWWVGVMVVNLAVAGGIMLWLRDHPERLARVISDQDLHQLVNNQFRDYYSSSPAQDFAARVWTNNVYVSILALFLGVTIYGGVYVLAQNTLNIGLVGGAMLGAGKGGEFFGLILPHGMLELTAVFIAGGMGLRVGWAWIAPGPLPRSRSLAAAGRTAGVVALGLIGVLLVSGVLEAFVTPSGLPTWARIGIGVLVEAAFLGYVFYFGRRGVSAGLSADLGVDEQGDLVPVT